MSKQDGREQHEQRILRVETLLRGLHEQGEMAPFVTELLRHYGADMQRFMAAMLRDPVHAAEAYAICCEDLWRGAAQFRYACSARTWAYTIARHAALRCRQQLNRQRQRDVPLSQLQPGVELEARARSSTALHMRTDARTRARNLRAHLKEDDRLLLGLRVDQKLSWEEIAHILSDEPLTDERTQRVFAARLRQRMRAIKQRLRTLASQQGVLPPSQ